MMPFFIALQFLSRLPVALERKPKASELGASTAYYPLVGLLAGLLVWLLSWLFAQDHVRYHGPLWSLLLTVFWVWFSSSLHLDGMADTLDGLASGQSGKAMLEVMHDSRTGAFGVLGLALAVLGKWIFVVSLPENTAWFIPLPFICSRLFLSLACVLRPYAGSKGSFSSQVILNAKPADSVAAFVAALVPILALCAFAWAQGAVSGLGVANALLGCVASLALGGLALWKPFQRLGGISGDLLGYGHEITELGCAFILFFLLIK